VLVSLEKLLCHSHCRSRTLYFFHAAVLVSFCHRWGGGLAEFTLRCYCVLCNSFEVQAFGGYFGNTRRGRKHKEEDTDRHPS
jgi:hypothetical protein